MSLYPRFWPGGRITRSGSQNNVPYKCLCPDLWNLGVWHVIGQRELSLKIELRLLISWPCMWEIVQDYHGTPIVIEEGNWRDRTEGMTGRGTLPSVAGSDHGGRGYMLRNSGASGKWKMPQDRFSPEASKRNITLPMTPSFYLGKIHFGLLSSRAVRI